MTGRSRVKAHAIWYGERKAVPRIKSGAGIFWKKEPKNFFEFGAQWFNRSGAKLKESFFPKRSSSFV
jgi:hypothetical protein